MIKKSFIKCLPIVSPTMYCFIEPSKPAIKSTTQTGSLGLIKSLSSRDPLTITIGDNAELLTKTELTIRCPVFGLPTPQVTWFAGRRKVVSGNKYLLGRGADLMIGSESYPTTEFDSMGYSCVASNVLGQDRAFSRVRFVGEYPSPLPKPN